MAILGIKPEIADRKLCFDYLSSGSLWESYSVILRELLLCHSERSVSGVKNLLLSVILRERQQPKNLLLFSIIGMSSFASLRTASYSVILTLSEAKGKNPLRRPFGLKPSGWQKRRRPFGFSPQA